MKMDKKAWRVLAAATGISFLAGLLYIWSVIAGGLVQQFGWTSKQASLPYTVATVCMVLAMAVFGRVQDKFGPRLTGMLSGLLIGIGLILSGLVSDPLLMVITFGIITGTGIGISSISTTPPAVKWFPPARKGLVTGIVVAGIGIASVFYSPLAHTLIETAGISATFLTIGVGALVLIVLLALLLVNPPAGYIAGGTIEAADAGKKDAVKPVTHAPDVATRDMVRRADFWLLWVMFAGSSAAGLMIIGHAANITRIQVGWNGGYLLVILLALFNASGRLLGGAVSDRIGKTTLLRIVFLVQAVNLLLFARYGSVPLLAVGVSVAGLCYGATFSIFPAAVMERFGVANFGGNYGLLMTAWGAGGVIGPMTAASIVDGTGAYRVAYLVACALLVTAAVLTFVTDAVTKRRAAAAATAQP